MAITIQQSPNTYSPVYNHMWYLCSSTNTAQSNFQYLFDLYITGQTFAGGTSYLRFKVPADPTHGAGVFDVARILERYLSSDIGDTIYGFQQNSNSILEYTVKCGEEYGASSGVTQYANLTVDSARYAFNGSLDFSENKTYAVSDYVANSVASNSNVNLLTNRPSSGTIRTGDDAWLAVMSQTSGAIKFVVWNNYENNTLLNTTKYINHQYFNTSTVANRSLRFPIGANIINISTSDKVYYNSLTIGTANKYEIYFEDSTHKRITESHFFKINDECTSHTVYRLHFLNKLGAFDSFNFIRGSQFSTEIKRISYEKPLGQFLSATSYTYNQSDSLTTNFYTEMQDTVMINSDWVDENTYQWLDELVTSPVVYYDDSTYGLVAVNIEETNFTRRKHLTDKVFNLQIKIKYTYKRYRQR